jgi:hypothetical protein
MALAPTPDDLRYFAWLHRGQRWAVVPQDRAVSFRDGSKPLLNECGPNSQRYVDETSGSHWVCGWSFRLAAGHPGWSFCYGHIILEEAAKLLDITPRADPFSDPAPFVRHPGRVEEWIAIRSRCDGVAFPPGFDGMWAADEWRR